MAPTNGIILLAKTVNACATAAIAPVLGDDSQGFIPLLWLDAEIPPSKVPKVRVASSGCCDQNKAKQKSESQYAWRKSQYRCSLTNSVAFPWQAKKPCSNSRSSGSPAGYLHCTRNTKKFCFLCRTGITTGMSQCLDVLPLATGRARAGLEPTIGKQNL